MKLNNKMAMLALLSTLALAGCSSDEEKDASLTDGRLNALMVLVTHQQVYLMVDQSLVVQV